jgi:hypothetical protein
MARLGHIYSVLFDTKNVSNQPRQTMDSKPMDVLSRKRGRTKENITKIVETLMKNSNKLQIYGADGADAYLLVHWRGQVWQYSYFISRHHQWMNL